MTPDPFEERKRLVELAKKANSALHNALLNGSIPKSKTLFCHECGEAAQRYYHHKGYESEHWLDVIPLCLRCFYKVGQEQSPKCQGTTLAGGSCKRAVYLGLDYCVHHWSGEKIPPYQRRKPGHDSLIPRLVDELTHEGEVWRVIPGFDNYQVSNLGRVMSLRGVAPRIMKPGRYGSGYLGLHLSGKDKKRCGRAIHRLVLLAFVGPCPEGMEVCHNDNNPSNNRLDNLRYDTHLANMQDTTRLKKGQG